jgi:hypothetical protein
LLRPYDTTEDETPGSKHSGPVSDVLAKVAAKGA